MNTTCLQASNSMKKITLNAMDQFLTGFLSAERHAKVLYALVYHGCRVERKEGGSGVLTYLYSDSMSCLQMEEEEIRESLAFLKRNGLITPVSDGGYLLSEELLDSIPAEEGDTAHLDFRTKLLQQDIVFLRSARLQRMNTSSKMVYADSPKPGLSLPVNTAPLSKKVMPLFPEDEYQELPF